MNSPPPPGFVAVPCQDWLWTASADAFLRLTTGLPPGSSFLYGAGGSRNAAANRNELTEFFLSKPDLEWICYIDSDMTPPVDTIERLLSHNVDVVGARCFGRVPPYICCFQGFADRDYYQDCKELCEVKAVGTGCLLIRRKIIEAMPYPWFEHNTGEDILFCERAAQLGAKIYMDCGLDVGHLTPRAVTSAEAFALDATTSSGERRIIPKAFPPPLGPAVEFRR